MNWLADDDLKVLSEDFFDDFINHIDFPLQDINGEGDWNVGFQHLEPPPMFSSFPSEFAISSLKQSSSCEALSEIKTTSDQSLSPVSVLESSDSSFSPKSQRLSFSVKGIRSKRKRPTKLRFRYPFESSKLEKLTLVESESKTNGLVRKCTHCETTKTPQWREGPNGPKTLCNACGVRFRSGRLVPEYRPASSPSFIPFLHSNSHRKIIEMRRNEELGDA